MPAGPLRGRLAPEVFQEEAIPTQPCPGAVCRGEAGGRHLVDELPLLPREVRDARLRRQNPARGAGGPASGLRQDLALTSMSSLLILAQFVQVLEESRLPRRFGVF